ncbi:MAG: biotin synthase BioB [Thermodesulfovibrionia bacterium]|nr:biotin synthase BioB [Thermodesulfovibrionia bacterium]
MPLTLLKKRDSNSGIDKEIALLLSQLSGDSVYELMELSNMARVKNIGNTIDLCSIVNAKSGGCSEDCHFCAQSVHNNTGVDQYPLFTKKQLLESAIAAKRLGVKRFCIVTSGKRPSDKELDEICYFVYELRTLGLLPCATLGLLDITALRRLKEAGLHRYHHNLETSEEFFNEICTTHTYWDKIRTIQAAKTLKLSVCSGGIFGLGETWEDRIDMAFALKDLDVDCVPINFLTPVSGTPLGDINPMTPAEALKIIAIYRLILPDRSIRVCGGRDKTLKDLQSFIFTAGADGLLLGNYLTTSGRNPDDDIRMIKDLGLKI